MAHGTKRKLWPDKNTLKEQSDTIRTVGKWGFYFILIGLIAGLGSVFFHFLCQIGSHFLLDQIAGYRPPAPPGEGHLFEPTKTVFNRWVLLFLPVFGGLISGWLVYTFAPEAEGHGTDAAIDSYHNKGGFIRGRIPIIKTFASAITLTSGGSGGREGPIAQIGAGFGSFLATKLKLSDRERRIMLAAGMGAGVGSIFRAPLAGALFAAEVLYRDPEFESEVIIPAGISSVVAYCVFCLVFGWGSLFETEPFVFRNPLELGPYTILAVVLAAAGFMYVKSFYGVQGAFKKMKLPNHIKPAIGGLLTGAIGFFLPEALSFGYGFAQMALDNELPALFLLALALGKILTTSFSIGSGGSGGVFGPSVVIGGALGGAVGRIFHDIMPNVVTQPGAFVVVGMAGFFAGVSNTPISTIIFVSEMTNSYHLLLPGLLVCSLVYLISQKWTIYDKQAKSKIDSNAHRGDFFVDILEAIRVKELTGKFRKVQLIPQDMPLKRFRKIFSSSHQHYYPVVDKDHRLTGIFSINDIRGVIFDQEIGDLVRMKDVANPDIIFTTPDEDLNAVLKKCTIRNLQRVPVVRDEDHAVLIGMLDRRDLIECYNKRVEEMKAGTAEHPKSLAASAQDREMSRFRGVLVGDAMTPTVEPVNSAVDLEGLKKLIYESRFSSFPVVDDEGRLKGILSISDCKRALKKGKRSTTAGHMATHDVVTVTRGETLLSALTKITSGDYAVLPVVDRDDPEKLLGVISRSDMMSAFNDVMVEKEKGAGGRVQ
jgi:chloride channel protein, CIC family